MDWIINKQNYPKEIVDFLESVFEIHEIRRRNLGKVNGISFAVNSNELNHTIPHIHAKYAEFSISIAINDQKILAGNLPKKQERIAVDWVRNNKDKLLNDWNNLTISATSIMTVSAIESLN